MRVLSWIVRAVLFLVMLGFAISNTEPTVLRFFGSSIVWRAPLVVFLLVFFAAGALVGVLSAIPAMYRQRREIGRLRRDARGLAPAGEPSRDLLVDPIVPPPL